MAAVLLRLLGDWVVTLVLADDFPNQLFEHVAQAMATCFVCRSEDAAVERDVERLRFVVDCEVCGRYAITHEAAELLGRTSDRRLLPYLTVHLRQATDADAERVLVTTENWEELARAHVSVPLAQKRERLLEYISTHSSPGEWVPIENDRRLAASLGMKDEAELDFVVAYLHDVGYLRRGSVGGRPDGEGGQVDTRRGLLLTVIGWDVVAPTGGGVPGTCFVAMSFHESLAAVFTEGIAPAVADTGFRVLRVDREPHNDNITDRIIGGIRSAQFLVADFTLQRQGVYYEAGFAQGLGRPVIRTCRADDFEHLHFDTRQFFHLKWETAADLRARLADHIRATIPGAR
jgi:hypothetical protein